MTTQCHIAAIAVRTVKNGPMKEVPYADASVNGGLTGDLPVKPHRGISFISKEQWAEVQDEMGIDMPWHTRRANVLVEGIQMSALLDRTLHIGEVIVEVTGETHPCGLMDRIQPGLRNTLEPYCRGGVLGHVIKGGRITVGDAIIVK